MLQKTKEFISRHLARTLSQPSEFQEIDICHLVMSLTIWTDLGILDLVSLVFNKTGPSSHIRNEFWAQALTGQVFFCNRSFDWFEV